MGKKNCGFMCAIHESTRNYYFLPHVWPQFLGIPGMCFQSSESLLWPQILGMEEDDEERHGTTDWMWHMPCMAVTLSYYLLLLSQGSYTKNTHYVCVMWACELFFKVYNSIPVADLFQTKSQKEVCRVSILVEFAIADPYVHIQRALLNPIGLTKLQEETKRIW